MQISIIFYTYGYWPIPQERLCLSNKTRLLGLLIIDRLANEISAVTLVMMILKFYFHKYSNINQIKQFFLTLVGILFF